MSPVNLWISSWSAAGFQRPTHKVGHAQPSSLGHSLRRFAADLTAQNNDMQSHHEAILPKEHCLKLHENEMEARRTTHHQPRDCFLSFLRGQDQRKKKPFDSRVCNHRVSYCLEFCNLSNSTLWTTSNYRSCYHNPRQRCSKLNQWWMPIEFVLNIGKPGASKLAKPKLGVIASPAKACTLYCTLWIYKLFNLQVHFRRHNFTRGLKSYIVLTY